MNSKILRKAEVFFKDSLAGYLYETKDGYTFIYDGDFLKKNEAIASSFPLRKEPFESEKLFPFFQGLLPEGWYLDLVIAKQKVERDDPFGILLSTASGDTIGAVTVRAAA